MPQKETRGELLFELGKALLKINALKLGTFTKRDGSLTPYFIDLKKLASFPDAFSLASKCLKFSVDRLKEGSVSFDCICGIPVSGLLLSTIIAHQESKPLVYAVKQPTKSLRGFLKPGATVLIVDDVSETGSSLKFAVQAIRAGGGLVSDAVTLIDRSEGASKLLAELGITLHYFSPIEELYSTLQEKMVITEEQEEAIKASQRPNI